MCLDDGVAMDSKGEEESCFLEGPGSLAVHEPFQQRQKLRLRHDGEI